MVFDEMGGQQPPLVWSALGPGNPSLVTEIAMSSNWPADQFIYVVRVLTPEVSRPWSAPDGRAVQVQLQPYEGGFVVVLPESETGIGAYLVNRRDWERLPR
jgi:hypothetical protein